MRVVIDNEPLTGSPRSIAEALGAARLNAERRGRVVIEALLDGVPLRDAELSDPPTAPRSGGEMRFATADAHELVSATLLGVADSLVDVKEKQQQAAELLTAGRMSEAMDHLHHSLRSWEGVRQAVIDGTTLMGISVETLRVPTPGGERPMAEQVKSLADCLGDVKRAFGAEDWSGLADVLGYDMQDQAESWRKTLAGLAEQIRAAGQSAAPSPNPALPPPAPSPPGGAR